MFPDGLDYEVQVAHEEIATMFKNLCRDAIGSFVVL